MTGKSRHAQHRGSKQRKLNTTQTHTSLSPTLRLRLLVCLYLLMNLAEAGKLHDRPSERRCHGGDRKGIKFVLVDRKVYSCSNCSRVMVRVVKEWEWKRSKECKVWIVECNDVRR